MDAPLNGFGLIGLAVMGQSLALKVESRGFTVTMSNRSRAVTEAFFGAHTCERFDRPAGWWLHTDWSAAIGAP